MLKRFKVVEKLLLSLYVQEREKARNIVILRANSLPMNLGVFADFTEQIKNRILNCQMKLIMISSTNVI